MDPLALLCNLHADGPLTLQRLRDAGCADLVHVESASDQELTLWTELSPRAATRLRREARHLRERILPEGLDGEEATRTAEVASPLPVTRPEPLLEAPRTALEETVLEGTVPDEAVLAEAVGGEPALEEPALPASPQAAAPAEPEPDEARPSAEAMEAVIRTWRARDAEDPPAAHAPPVPEPPSPVEQIPQPSSAFLAEPPGTLTPRPRVAPAFGGTPLAGLEGLDEAVLRALTAAGVATVEALRDADALALSRSAGLGYTALARLQFLARRTATAAPAAADVTPPAPGTEPSAGGPFA
jgi:hypothetical protein